MKQHAVARIGFIANIEIITGVARAHDRTHGQAIFAGEIQIALVMGGTGKNRARAIAHQNKIGDIDRQQPVLVQRVTHKQAGIQTKFFTGLNIAFAGSACRTFGAESLHFGACFGQGKRQLVVGRNGAKTGAVKSVRSRGEHVQRINISERLLQFKPALQPLGTANPIALHEPHFFRPACQPVQRIQQITRIIGDFQKPLRQPLLLNRRARPPALAVNHLLIGQNSHIDRIPIDSAFAPVNQTGVKKIKEHSLFMAVIVRVASGKFAAPVNRQAEPL